jgi:GNAT superfamily N-acetyltransferase
VTPAIARASAADAEGLAPLFAAYRTFFTGGADGAESLAFLRERLERDESVVFGARDGDAWCGFIQLYPLWSSWYAGRIWFLSDLYVVDAARKQGVGRKLVERVKAFAAETEARSVMVELPNSEPTLRAFYAALAFHEDPVFGLARYTLP